MSLVYQVFVSIVGKMTDVEVDAYPLLKTCALDIICGMYSFHCALVLLPYCLTALALALV